MVKPELLVNNVIATYEKIVYGDSAFKSRNIDSPIIPTVPLYSYDIVHV